MNQEDIELIEWLKQYPIIYDMMILKMKSDKSFRNEINKIIESKTSKELDKIIKNWLYGRL